MSIEDDSGPMEEILYCFGGDHNFSTDESAAFPHPTDHDEVICYDCAVKFIDESKNKACTIH